MKVTSHKAALDPGASRLQRTIRAVLLHIQKAALPGQDLLAHQSASGRAPEGVSLSLIAKGGAIKEVALIVHGSVRRHAGHDAIALAGGRVRPIGVARIR